MAPAATVWFSSPEIGTAALAVAILAIGIAAIRRIDIPTSSAALLGVGVLLLAAAAAGPVWNRPKPGSIAVMVDLSPSTRGAKFRSADFLRQRIGALLRDSPHRVFGFARQNVPIDPSLPLAEMPADRTRFSPVSADAIVLFSDARFDLPTFSSPVYVVADEGLEDVADASVQRLNLRGQTLTATIANSGKSREANFPGTNGPSETIGPGSVVTARTIRPGAASAGVMLNPGDLWPENDSLSLPVAAPPASEKWWVGENPPGDDWKNLQPGSVSISPGDYLAPAVIVVNNEPATQFTPPQLDCLMQYVRDLGGSLLIVGGDHAFAAGQYQGTALEQMSPLASCPPKPTTRWILLVDASGSMSQDAGEGISRWQRAAAAASGLLLKLPPADPVQIGQFSDQIRWWLSASAADAAKTPLPPADAFAHGPTNLEPALNQIAEQSSGTLPTQLLLISDCDAEIDHPKQLAEHLARGKIALNVLAIGPGSGLKTIGGICAATGGHVVDNFDPRQWARSIAQLSQTALPPQLERQSISVEFHALGTLNAAIWNRTWLKPPASEWASAMRDSTQVPMAASWQVGDGCVAAVAWDMDPAHVEWLADQIAQRPRDPRFAVRWDDGRKIHVAVDAADAGKFINGLKPSLDLIGHAGMQHLQLAQTGPGRYETIFAATTDGRLATLRIGEETIDRKSLPGRYPEEFDSVGNDHESMQKLAQMSGGEVIWPTDHGPIHFHWPSHQISLSAWICAVAALAIAAGLIRWRIY